MFKRFFAVLLSLVLALSCLITARADVAVSELNQLDKLKGQWRTSGFRGTLTGETTGDMSALFGGDTWKQLQEILTKWSLSLTHTNQNASAFEGDETVLTLLNSEGAEAARFNVLTDASGVVYLQSPLLDDNGLYYAFDSGFDWSSLVFPTENGWPSLLHVLAEISRASKNWQEKAQPYLEQFSLKVNRWLQSYVTTSTEQDESGNYVTTTVYEVPIAAVKQETLQLLVDFYTNRELLALLSEIVTAEEAAAYLQPSMLTGFLKMIDNVKLDGSIRVRRQNDTLSGDVLFDSVSMPFAGALPVKELTITHVPKAEEGELWELSAALDGEQVGVAFGQDIEIALTAQNSGEAIWTGSLLVILPASDDPESLIQEDQTLFSCSYNLNIPEPKDNNDVYASRYERAYEMTLVVKPDDQMGLPPLSLNGTLVIYSKTSSQMSVVYVESGLTLTDLERESTVGLKFSGKTASRWTPTMLANALSSSLRIDMMSAQNRLAQLGELVARLTGSLTKIVIGQ